MQFAGFNYIAVLVAAIAAFGFGAVWYMTLSKQWMTAAGITERPESSAGPFILTFLCQLVMAWVLAGVIGHLGEITVVRSIISALFVWAGFVATTMIVNHRFQGAPWTLTLIDAGHWLGTLVIMGLVIGLFGV
ncbi:MAG TPA: DUF1761 domain-containing protein [Kiloniellaceae bacterium]|nr:DUF1761 domain-containing protein [Kiloniellaceae bacterium]